MAKVEQAEVKVRDHLIHCAGCEGRIESILNKLPGVLTVKADHRTQKVQVGLDPAKVSLQAVQDKLAAMGYETS